MVIGMTASFAYSLLYNFNSELAETMVMQIENRAYILLGNQDQSELSDLNTMDDRTEEFKTVQRRLINTPIKKIFGVGFGPVDMVNYGKNRIVVESLYHLLLSTMGYIGTFIFYLMMISLGIEFLKLRKVSNPYALCLSFASIMVVTLTSYSILTFGIGAIFGLIYVELCSTLNLYDRKCHKRIVLRLKRKTIELV
jgi:hypothetical protein